MHAGFRGTHLPVASSRREKDDSAAEMPEPYEDADMDVPNTQALLDAFMSNMSKLADAEYHGLSVLLDSLPDPSSFPPAKTMTAAMAKERGLIPEADEETLRAFSPSEMKTVQACHRRLGCPAQEEPEPSLPSPNSST